MPRAKKNPVTEMPVIEVSPIMGEPGKFEKEDFPTQHEPGSHGGIFDGIADRTKSNVVPISQGSELVQSARDWSEIDSVLSDVVNFGA